MRVAVVGAGLQGCCVALELARAGVAVDLYEAGSRCLAQASRNNEGKIHLGYVYANDPSLRTARLMVAGGLSFAPLLHRVGVDLAGVAVSAPSRYVVHRTGLLDAQAVHQHLLACQRLVAAASGPTTAYIGPGPDRATTPLAEREWQGDYDPRLVAAVFRTGERAIDPVGLCAAVLERVLDEPRIQLRLRCPVDRVRPGRRGLAVWFCHDGTVHEETYAHVVNAAWAGRLALDRSLGLVPDRPWLYRLRCNLRVALGSQPAPPCSSIVSGPFGDVIPYGNGEVNLSWYPAGLQGSWDSIEAPEWSAPETDPALAQAIAAGVGEVIPAVRGLSCEAVRAGRIEGGIIFAWGRSDIDDPGSGLHQRHAVGVHTTGNFHSVDTGKLTTAPMFARTVAQRICQLGATA